MISYGRMRTTSPPMGLSAAVVPRQEGYLRRQPAQVTGTPADLRNRAAGQAYTSPVFSETRYARNGDLRVAYRASPQGARDIVFLPLVHVL